MKNKEIKVSVLVYVLNDAAHIERSVRSVMEQTLQELEILLIDGGSTDGTLEKLEQLRDEDKRIRLIRSEAGVGCQFNTGLAAAVGKYIGICESDDYILPDMYRRQYETAEKYGLDVLKANVLRFCESGGEEYSFPFSLTADQGMFDVILYPGEDTRFLRLGVNGFWSGLYRREFLTGNGLWMNETEGASYQDITFSFLTELCARRAYIMKEAFYCYRMDNPDSSINNPRKTTMLHTEYQLLKGQLKQRGLWKQSKEIYWRWRLDSCFWFYDNLSDAMRAEYVPSLYQDIRNEAGAEAYNGTELTEREKMLCTAAETSWEAFRNFMVETDMEWQQMEQKISMLTPEEEVAIFGTGNLGVLVNEYLKQNGKAAVAGIDNNSGKWNRRIDGLMILMPGEGAKKYPDAVYIIANAVHADDMREQLVQLGIREKQIIVCKNYDLFLKKMLINKIKGKGNMEYQGVCDKIFKIREALQDEQSKILFDARLNYSISRDKWQLYKAVDRFEREWHCPVLETFMNQTQGNGLVIWGCGHDGREAKRTLDVCGYHLDYFCDSDSRLVGTQIDDIRVLSVDEMLENCKGYSVIVGSSKYREEMQKTLSDHGFPTRNVLSLGYGHLQAHNGKKQYFNVFEPEKDEVFIDAGAYDGGTILDFVQWTGGKYQKIYAMEPLHDMYCRIKEMCEQKHVDHIDIREIAAWNKEEKLYFTEELTGSRVEEEGRIVVNGGDIDSIAKEDRVTYIKMDIEGSELKALEGAKKTIQRNRPKLAVCLYHKFEDIVELPAYILELVPEYKFYIRHYCSDVCETVLYATV